MKVLAITPQYPPASLVGAWLATHKLLRHLVQRGNEVVAFTYSYTGKPWELDGVRVETARDGLVAARHLAADGVDLVINHVGDGGRGRYAMRGIDVPNVQLTHGVIPPVLDDNISLLVFNSQWKLDATKHDCPSIVVRPPTDPAEYATTQGDAVTLVNLAEQKGGRLFDQLARSMPSRPFLGVRGAYGSQAVPRRDNVEIMATTANMRDDVYARTRVLLMPSAYEAWGMAGIEAMCSGIPVIAHPCDGLLESLGDAGIFVNRADSQGWLDAIERLDDPEEYAAASKRSIDRVAELDLLAGLDVFADAVEALVPNSKPPPKVEIKAANPEIEAMVTPPADFAEQMTNIVAANKADPSENQRPKQARKRATKRAPKPKPE